MSRLDEIRERWEKATPGPWGWWSRKTSRSCFVARRTKDGPEGFGITEGVGREADAEAIAHAPEDIAYLLAEVERRREALEGSK